MRLGRVWRSKRGDTIVEVLIAIAVISSVVGTAYAITNKSVQSNVESQQRSRATKIAQTQLEMLKVWTGNPTNTPSAFVETKFCLYSDSVGAKLERISAPVPTANNSDYPTNCRQDNELYMVGITRTSDELFTVYVDWDGETGNRDTLSMAYKAYQ